MQGVLDDAKTVSRFLTVAQANRDSRRMGRRISQRGLYRLGIFQHGEGK